MPRRGSVERGLDGLRERRVTRLGLGTEAPHRAIRRDQELLEVPFDVPGLARRIGHRRQLDVQGMAVGPVDAEFLEDRKGHTVARGAKLANLFRTARLLRA